jgi:DNA polymerase-3 subunit gamma/tau
MSRVLYRKYRSQDFDQLIGQEHITKILKNAVLSDKVSHAYLFVGSRGTGKTSTARILAKALNCKNLKKDGNPCSKCESCIAIAEGNFLDLIEIDAASNRGIDQIRELKERLEFSPTEGKYKIYIVDEVHMLTKEAFNALLKTLEEPPAHVIFILATTDVHKLPATILSRCQRYDFRLGTGEQIKEVLEQVAKTEKIKFDEAAMKILVENAHGSYRDALSLLDVVVSGQLGSDKPQEVSEGEVRKVLGIPDSTMVCHLLEKLVKGDRVGALDLISEIESKGVNLQQFTKYVLNVLREILVDKLRGELDPKEYSFAVDLEVSDVSHLINLFLNAERSLKSASTPSLVLEMIVPEVNINLSPAPAKEVKESVKQDEESEVSEEEDMSDAIEESDKKLSFKKVASDWAKVIEGIKPSNGHLFAFLGSAKLIDMQDNVLKLEVPFEFHKDRIESASSRDAIANVMRTVFGVAVKVSCTVNGAVKKQRPVSADVVLSRAQPSEPKAPAPKKTFIPRTNPKIEEIFAGM